VAGPGVILNPITLSLCKLSLVTCMDKILTLCFLACTWICRRPRELAGNDPPYTQLNAVLFARALIV
jgi:hypothetical protein